MNKIIAIRREDKSKWERRAPLVPRDIVNFAEQGIEFCAQPSDIRVFDNASYEDAGVKITEDVMGADLLMGVKEMPISYFKKNGAYMFFSHTIKGQANNMEMLNKLIELNCTLIDYECIVDEKGRRTVFFGKYAGLAGMIDTFHVLGKRLEHEGVSSIFSEVKMSYEYGSLEKAFNELRALAEKLKQEGIPEAIKPLVIGFAGYGNVSCGAQEIFDIFPSVEVSPEQLSELEKLDIPHNKLVKVVFKEEHTVEPIEPMAEFDKFHYFANPTKYRSIFAKYLDKLSVLVNCIYWSAESPRLMTIEDAKKIHSQKNPKLKVIGDISCDIKGGIECTLKATQPDVPAYVYDVNSGSIVEGVEGNGPVIMAVDNLPCELAKESSEAFSEALKPFVPSLGKINFDVDFEQADLPDPIKKAVILWKGKFTPKFSFMNSYIR